MQGSQRCFGGMPGGPREKLSSNAANTDFQVPNEADIKYHTPANYQPNDMFLAWVSGKWAVDRSDRLMNDKVNKYSAYYWLGNSALGNQLSVKLVRMLFGRKEGVNNVIDTQGSYNGITDPTTRSPPHAAGRCGSRTPSVAWRASACPAPWLAPP